MGRCIKFLISVFKLIAVSVLSLSFLASANTDIAFLENGENQLYKDPYNYYQKVLNLKEQVPTFSKETHYLWLLRKAQSENLLWLRPAFKATVAYAIKEMEPGAPAEYISNFQFFAGRIAQQDGHYSEAVEFLNLAMSIAEEEGLSRTYVMAKQELAYTRSLTELFDTSLAGLQEAYVEAFALDDLFLLAIINESYGAIYGYMDEFEKSIEYYEKALETYERLGFVSHIAEAIFGIATTYRYWQKYDLAIEYFNLYQEKTAFTPNQNITFYAVYGLGMTLAEKGDCPAAINTINQAFSRDGLRDYEAELYKRLAMCHIKMGELVKAREAIDKANDILNSIPELQGTTWQLEVEKLYGLLAKARGDTELAYQIMVQYYEKYIDVTLNKSNSRLMKVRTSMEIERQNIEISLLQQRSKVKILEIEQKHQENVQKTYLIFSLLAVIGMIIILLYLQRRTNKKIFELSIKDSLSGLYNRRYIFKHMDRLMEKYRGKGGFAVILIDIDDFKEINDLYGHPFGDKVIKALAEVSLKVLRVGDEMARIGGEEFLCVCARIDQNQAIEIAQRLKESVQNLPLYRDNGHPVRVTVSVGVAIADENTKDSQSIYVAADKALYHSKDQGKNQVSLYADVGPVMS